ncbi:MAG: 16S rRNA (cytidine(1402)-2'-O)-methyltransferase [Vicinamibacterales bacterium]
MAGTLYIVGTPIGNLEDVTMRALRVLREVDLIAAEDTRRTARLLQHYSIATPATSLHEHNERGKAPHLIARLQAGASIALVSDAGMPLVSDPGAWLVTAAREAGIPIQVVPGPSAVTAALAGAGMSGPFGFLGFPPSSGRPRKDWMRRLAEMGGLTVVFFEAPHRMAKTLGELHTLLGDRPIMVAKELTKVHESLVEQPISTWLDAPEGPALDRGEFVVIVPPWLDVGDNRAEPPGGEAVLHEMGDMTNRQGMKPRAAAKALAAKYRLSADDIYELHSKREK